MSFVQSEIVVSKKDPKNAGKYVEVGKVTIHVPTLAELVGRTFEQATDEKGALLVDDDGIPVYKDDIDNYVQNALVQAVKSKARNSLVSGTATLKDGKTIPTNWAELTAESLGGGNPAALTAIRELKAAFNDWVVGQKKSAGATQLLTTLFNNKAALESQSTDNKGKMTAYITQFASTLPEDFETTNQYGARYLQALLDIAESTDEAEDF